MLLNPRWDLGTVVVQAVPHSCSTLKVKMISGGGKFALNLAGPLLA